MKYVWMKFSKILVIACALVWTGCGQPLVGFSNDTGGPDNDVAVDAGGDADTMSSDIDPVPR